MRYSKTREVTVHAAYHFPPQYTAVCYYTAAPLMFTLYIKYHIILR